MTSSRASQRVSALSFATAGSLAAVASLLIAATPAAASSQTPLKKKVVDTTTSIYRCTLADGSVAYSDIRCKGASKVERWKAEKIAPGIAASNRAPMNDMLDDAATSGGQRDDPYVACRKIGGKWFVAARLCKLAPEARIRMSFN